jgi:hypothetical protein
MKRALVAIFIFIADMVAGTWLDDWLDIETWLDRGGAWDYQRETCSYR